MQARELVAKYLNFFAKRGHQILPSAPLVLKDDSSALFVSAGMQPLIPYLLGKPHPQGKRLASLQKCLRTTDIESVGDTFHHTFFEMLGNWSLGDYFKEEAIAWSYEFLTSKLHLSPQRLSVTVFSGDHESPRDEESAQIWQKIGISKDRLYYLGKKDNWWSAGPVGPCGPDTEVFYDTDPGRSKCSHQCRPGCSCGKYFEIWNDVFMVYNRLENGQLKELPQKNVDTGLGLERTIAVLQGKNDNYQTELFTALIDTIEKLSGKTYQEKHCQKAMRIIADHLRASCFLIADGVLPGNKKQGYILRRLIRSSLRQGRLLNIKDSWIGKMAKQIIKDYHQSYQELKDRQKTILAILENEEKSFSDNLARGLKEFNNFVTMIQIIRTKTVPGELVFKLYDTYGFPPEMTEEMAAEKGLSIDMAGFQLLYAKHQQKSRAKRL